MKNRGQGKSPHYHAGWKQIWPYALLSLVAFVCGCLFLAAFIWHADRIVALGLTGKLYYLALLPLGLCVSLILFGVLRAYAKYRGRVFGGWLELGGPAVGFFLVVVLGFVLPEPAQNFSLTIIAHGPKGNTDMVLRSNGSIILDTGGLRRTAAIGVNGDAVFLEIPASLRGQKASVGLDADGFELTDRQTALTLTPNTFYVEVHQKPGRLAGYIKDSDGQPLPAVTVSVGNIRTVSNDQGYFEMYITDEEGHHNVTLVATKPGYRTWTGFEIANSNDVIITLERVG
jgi:hypothetical protein